MRIISFAPPSKDDPIKIYWAEQQSSTPRIQDLLIGGEARPPWEDAFETTDLETKSGYGIDIKRTVAEPTLIEYTILTLYPDIENSSYPLIEELSYRASPFSLCLWQDGTTYFAGECYQIGHVWDLNKLSVYYKVTKLEKIQ